MPRSINRAGVTVRFQRTSPREGAIFLSFRGGLFVVEQMREPIPHITRLIEMTGHAMGAPADGKCEAAEIGHDREHGFIRDVVADKSRTATPERFVRHQFN